MSTAASPHPAASGGRPAISTPQQAPAMTIVIAFYNNTRWLRLILDALQMQSMKDFEVVVADDGSSDESVAALKAYIRDYPEMRILHAWHPDQGWRKNAALNNAVRMSHGEYIVFIDGDCIPHPDFMKDHYRLRRHGFVTGGRRVESDERLSSMIEGFDRLPDDFFSRARRCILGSIFSKGALVRLRRTWRFPMPFGKPLNVKRRGILGANFGIYRDDLYKVNGFDERYLAPGTGEDCDLDARLANAGIGHLKVSHYALMIHRCHARLDWSSEENAELYRRAREERLTYVDTGLFGDSPAPAGSHASAPDSGQ
ncbi:MAG: glycosyltransferase [Muribaculaceae bacterium]|nr:glycosyltransferase [Muribaculaceae bacterium]